MASSSSIAAGDGSGALGLINVDGRRVSARLNPALVAQLAIPSDEQIEQLIKDSGQVEEVAPADPKGGRRLQRGGDGTWAEWTKAKYAFTKAIVMMTGYTFAQIALEAGTSPTAVGATETVTAYLTRELTPIKGVGVKLAAIIGRLVEQVFIKTPITAVVLSTATLGYTANVVRYIFDISNTYARGTADWLLNDDNAKRAAQTAVGSVKDATFTAAVGATVANQIGILPLSAVLAAILFTLQINLGSGAGRGYLVASFYSWYLSQPKEARKEIDTSAREYVSSVTEAAKPMEIKGKVKTAADKLGSLLAQGAAAGVGKVADVAAKAGQTAFEAVADAAKGKGIKVAAKPPPAAGDSVAASAAVAEGAEAAAAAIAESAAEGRGVASSSSSSAAAPSAVGAPGAEGSRKRGRSAASAAPSAASGAPLVAVGPEGEEADGDDGAAGPGAAGPGAAGPGAAAAEAPVENKRRRPLNVAAPEFKKGVGGKTKKGKSKRRVTRRRKAPKYLAAPVFVY
jgi:hypothetical protein